jgi:hypothetical protein
MRFESLGLLKAKLTTKLRSYRKPDISFSWLLLAAIPRQQANQKRKQGNFSEQSI